MRTLKFYGCSNDLFEIEGVKADEIDDEIGCYRRSAYVKVSNEEEGLIVVGEYGKINACWMVGILPLDEDVEIPSDWIKSIKLGGRNYSTELLLEVPNDAVVSEIRIRKT